MASLTQDQKRQLQDQKRRISNLTPSYGSNKYRIPQVSQPAYPTPSLNT